MIPQVVNWHITYGCNYKCKFCYFRTPINEPEGLTRLKISLKEAENLINILSSAGVKRINFAGGEPTLVREFPELVKLAYNANLKPTVVTNGTGLNDYTIKKISPYIKAVKISVDSASENTEKLLGRGYGNHIRNAIEVSTKLRHYGITMMMNTVVTRLNYLDDMHDIVNKIKPIRWKVYQVLKVEGQNEREFNNLEITTEQFKQFIKRHSDISVMFPEDNEQMTESYAMIDPEGRFFQNTGGKYTYSESILNVGIDVAFSQVKFNWRKYSNRENGNSL